MFKIDLIYSLLTWLVLRGGWVGGIKGWGVVVWLMRFFSSDDYCFLCFVYVCVYLVILGKVRGWCDGCSFLDMSHLKGKLRGWWIVPSLWQG